ncbi:MAG: transcriptional repressor [Solirubrobacteraceae bacterium]|nr:transcriptional repressor [Solirubrobacteraceae bacterium]
MNATARRRWLEHTDEVLRGAGLRASSGRTAVVELLARQDCLMTAQEIVDALRATDGASASTATVYRALETLHEFGLVRRFDSGEGIARYEPVDPSGAHHHHVVFEDGEVEPFSDEELETAIHGIGRRLGLDITGHDVILRARKRS